MITGAREQAYVPRHLFDFGLLIGHDSDSFRLIYPLASSMDRNTSTPILSTAKVPEV
jgi:hypothetical protein